MAKPTIAEVLHYAADYCLVEPGNNYKLGKKFYSCNAVVKAALALRVKYVPILDGLCRMGVSTGSTRMFLDVKDPQGARYMWLKFAALMAEEQGV
jgi:hypothetical protein